MKQPPRHLPALLRADRRGLTSLEFGLVALPFTLLLFAVVEIGLVVRMKSALQYATTQTARCLVVDSLRCGTVEAARAYAVTQSQGVSVSAAAFTITTAACGRRVTANVAFPIVAHKVIPKALTLSAQACYPM
jgi:Flp pilus assembly protein TadG